MVKSLDLWITHFRKFLFIKTRSETMFCNHALKKRGLGEPRLTHVSQLTWGFVEFADQAICLSDHDGPPKMNMVFLMRPDECKASHRIQDGTHFMAEAGRVSYQITNGSILLQLN